MKNQNPYITLGTNHLEQGDSFHPVSDSLLKGLTQEKVVSRDNRRLYASSGGLCARREVGLVSQEPTVTVVTPTTQFYLELGKKAHDVVSDGFEADRTLLFKEYKIPDIGVNLGGYIDNLVLIDGKVYVVEVKTCGSLPDKPKLDHKMQALVYSAVTGFPAVLVYISRHVSDYTGELMMKTFDLAGEEEAMKEAMKQVVTAYYSSNIYQILPVIPHYLNPTQCKAAYCPFVSFCWDRKVEPAFIGLINSEKAPDKQEKIQNLVEEFLTKFWNGALNRKKGILKYILLYGSTIASKKLADMEWESL